MEDPRWTVMARLAAARFGVRGFRPGQRELIEAVLKGRDTLGVLPIGGGKSLTYQLPALTPDAATMGGFGLLALAVNVGCLVLLPGVIAASVKVRFTGSWWSDAIVGAGIAT